MNPDLARTTGVRDMPSEERPRERLKKLGPEVLRDAELLAVLFRTGTREFGAVDLAGLVINHFKGLRGLARASLEELRQIKGLGEVKAIEIKAALELGKRLANFSELRRDKISSAKDVADLLMASFKDRETEQFRALHLNKRNEVINAVIVSEGGLDATIAMPRDVFRQAIRDSAASIIVSHNHPSGDPEPSQDDIRLTRRLAEAGKILGIELLDHVIFGDGRYTSLKERNHL